MAEEGVVVLGFEDESLCSAIIEWFGREIGGLRV